MPTTRLLDSQADSYQSLVAKLSKTQAQLRWIYKITKPPIYIINLVRNRITIKAYFKDGKVEQHDLQADFSSSRLLLADFDKATDALASLLQQFPRHPWLVSAFAHINIVDEWQDGLTMIETKALGEMIRVASMQAKRNILDIKINEQTK